MQDEDETGTVAVTFHVRHGQTTLEAVEAVGADTGDGPATVSGSVYHQLRDMGVDPAAHGIERREAPAE